MANRIRVDVWSDLACPWCYIGKRRLQVALQEHPDPASVEVVWRAFELDPSAPRAADPTLSHVQRLARKYGVSEAQAQAMNDRVAALGQAEGLDFHFDRLRSGNTFDAHRVVRLGLLRGRQDAVKERLFRGYFAEGELLSDHDTLVRLGAEAGLDAEDVRAMLGGEELGPEVREDERQATQLGIRGVPTFVFDGRFGISGAQPAETLRRLLERAASAGDAALAESDRG